MEITFSLPRDKAELLVKLVEQGVFSHIPIVSAYIVPGVRTKWIITDEVEPLPTVTSGKGMVHASRGLLAYRTASPLAVGLSKQPPPATKNGRLVSIFDAIRSMFRVSDAREVSLLNTLIIKRLARFETCSK